MKAYIWKVWEGLTGNYHSGGGCLVIAENVGQARALLATTSGVSMKCKALYEDPCLVLDLVGKLPESKVIIFPDAGCC
jgi:hypothetical protein